MAKAKDLDAKEERSFSACDSQHTVALMQPVVWDGERVRQSTHTALDTISTNYYVRLPFRTLYLEPC